MGKSNIILLLEYKGTKYYGWQRQPDKPTIQGILEELFSSFLKEPIKIIGAGRTDSGVHAIGQVANFITTSDLPPKAYFFGIKGLLPEDIRIKSVIKGPLYFHSRYHAKKKTYIYRIQMGTPPSIFLKEYCWHIKENLDLMIVKEALSYIVGTHDFKVFQASGSSVRTTIRTIYQANINYGDHGHIVITITGNGFLRHMVRNIVGTIVEIGRKKIPPSKIKSLIELGDRSLAGPTAPAHGLFLSHIYYEGMTINEYPAF